MKEQLLLYSVFNSEYCIVLFRVWCYLEYYMCITLCYLLRWRGWGEGDTYMRKGSITPLSLTPVSITPLSLTPVSITPLSLTPVSRVGVNRCSLGSTWEAFPENLPEKHSQLFECERSFSEECRGHVRTRLFPHVNTALLYQRPIDYNVRVSLTIFIIKLLYIT